MLENISLVIIVKNGARTIQKTLNALQDFADVVVYDNGSTDKTVEIAQTFANVNIIKGQFIGFGQTKNKAATYAQNDWILSLDVDEVITTKLLNNIAEINLDIACVYKIFRKNFYKQQHIKHCWGNDDVVRLYNRQQTEFNDKKVHEKIKINKLNVKALSGFIEHYPYNNISDFITKLDVYSTEFAKEYVGKKRPSPLKAILNAGFSFFKTYVLKRGFLDGYAGLVIAFSHMATNFYKYVKLYELNKK